jgi:hypothetical protein
VSIDPVGRRGVLLQAVVSGHEAAARIVHPASATAYGFAAGVRDVNSPHHS